MRPDWLACGLACFLLVPAGALARVQPTPPPGQISKVGNVNLGLAINYLQTGQYPHALQRAKLASESDPKSTDVLTVLAMIHARMGQQQLAGQTFARAAKLAPEDGGVNNAYGAWLCQHRSPAEGQALLEKALSNPGRQTLRNVRMNASQCAIRAGNPAKAEGMLRELLGQSPEDSAALLLLARALHAQGHDFEARAFLQRCETLGPLSAEGYELAVEIETGAGDAKSAARYRALLRERYPDHSKPTGEGAGRP